MPAFPLSITTYHYIHTYNMYKKGPLEANSNSMWYSAMCSSIEYFDMLYLTLPSYNNQEDTARDCERVA